MATPVNGSSSAGTEPATTTVQRQTLGQDAFMKLLITQLTHQDPTKPKEDTEFIAQLATFSQLEKLTTMTSQLESLAGIAESMSRLETKLDELQRAIDGASGTESSTGTTTAGTA